MPGRAVLNLSAAAFLAVVGVLFARSRTKFSVEPKPWRSIWCFIPVITAMVAYAESLNYPFLFDDYVHLSNASSESFSGMLRRVLFDHPSGGDMFFRPLGYVSYWINFRWAGFSPALWHAYGLALHVANTLLVFFLCRKLFIALLPVLTASLLFALHGSHVEAVCWLAAQFDLLATMFVLLALLFALEERPFLVTICSALACCSKESAYALPMLIACLAFFRPKEQRRILWNSIWSGTACCAVFLYRWWYLRGMGGYQSAFGGFHLASLAQAMFFRIWSFLFVPLNWSYWPSAWLIAPLSFVIGISLLSRVNRARLSASLAFTICAALPVFALLLIGSNMSGARVLYLPSVGMALMWAVVADGVKRADVLCGALACFQFAALWHNQKIWGRTAQLAKQACLTAADALQRNPSAKIYAYDLPKVKDGVYFLENGFPQCVAIAGGVSSSRISTGPKESKPADGALVYTWNVKAGQLEEAKAN
jgi:hypothetical protein